MAPKRFLVYIFNQKSELPMTSVGAFEAKTHLSALLDKVEAGEEVTITRHGRAIARLVPAEAIDTARAIKAANELKQMRKGVTLGLSWKELRDEGRR
ncbi:type II toxin-antitoxin system prevent-host-death family antitoxin [Caulobacter sp. SLTY]|uniref:type II toxin-antitoxin system prevent-host-death family antitoxin n=1 Tax=Caulobacter sp. SLTY TaxID=2683262 RepID=UPI00196B0D0D